jgi:hypothetical protein
MAHWSPADRLRHQQKKLEREKALHARPLRSRLPVAREDREVLHGVDSATKKHDPFLALIQAHGLPAPQTEFQFLPDRKFRADYCWPEAMVIVEKHGGIFRGGKGGGSAKGGHSSALGILRDLEKCNLAQLAGWTYLQFEARQLNSGEAMPLIAQVLR